MRIHEVRVHLHQSSVRCFPVDDQQQNKHVTMKTQIQPKK
jgi:hypothetical protein